MSQEMGDWVSKVDALIPLLDPHDDDMTVGDALRVNGQAVIAVGPVHGAIVTGSNVLKESGPHESMTVAFFRAVVCPLDEHNDKGDPVVATFVIEGEALFSMMSDFAGFGFQAMRQLEHLRDVGAVQEVEKGLLEFQATKPEDVMKYFEPKDEPQD